MKNFWPKIAPFLLAVAVVLVVDKFQTNKNASSSEFVRNVYREYISHGNEEDRVPLPSWQRKKIRLDSWRLEEIGGVRCIVVEGHNESGWSISSIDLKVEGKNGEVRFLEHFLSKMMKSNSLVLSGRLLHTLRLEATLSSQLKGPSKVCMDIRDKGQQGDGSNSGNITVPANSGTAPFASIAHL